VPFSAKARPWTQSRNSRISLCCSASMGGPPPLPPPCSLVGLAVQEEPTTVVIQRYLDALPGDPAAEPLIRELLDRAVGRVRLLWARPLGRGLPGVGAPACEPGDG